MKITKRQLRRIIREETIGVEDANYTADSFGGGEAGEEMFIDVDADELLNVNEKRPGATGKVADIEVIPERKRITKRQLRKIIAEEKQKLLKENLGDLEDFKVTVFVRLPARSVDYIYDSITDGMEFDEEMGEGILDYKVEKV